MTERFVEVADGVRLWVRESGGPGGSVVLLVMGAGASGLTWPRSLVDALGERHRVVVYDHRDTGASSWAFARHPYAITDLAGDAVAVLDALGVDRAHVVGMSLGGTLVQLLALDRPERLLSATVLATAVLHGAPVPDGVAPQAFSEIDPDLLELWEHFTDPRDLDAEIAWRVEHWRLLNGPAFPFDAGEFEALERAVVAHAGRHDNPAAHAAAATTGLDRGAELARVDVPFLVVEAPLDPVNPPPAARRIAGAVPGARLVTLPDLGHALPEAAGGLLADVVLPFLAEVDAGA